MTIFPPSRSKVYEQHFCFLRNGGFEYVGPLDPKDHDYFTRVQQGLIDILSRRDHFEFLASNDKGYYVEGLDPSDPIYYMEVKRKIRKKYFPHPFFDSVVYGVMGILIVGIAIFVFYKLFSQFRFGIETFCGVLIVVLITITSLVKLYSEASHAVPRNSFLQELENACYDQAKNHLLASETLEFMDRQQIIKEREQWVQTVCQLDKLTSYKT